MFTYFLQVNICWLLFYGLYYVLLSKETFFTLNRIYLIISLLAGLVLPFLADWLKTETPLYMPLESITLPEFVVGMQTEVFQVTAHTEGVSTWTTWTFIKTLYGIGVTIMFARFLYGLFNIIKTLKKASLTKENRFLLANTEGVTQPFSFLNIIFINPYLYQNSDYESIIKHEKAHVLQKHTYDILLLEIINIIFWCSPLIYIYKNSIKIIHEYLADAAVLQSASKKQYGTLLIQQAQSGNVLALVNPFFSQLKKRLIMMTRNPSKRRALIKYVLALPIFLVLVSFLATPDNVAITHLEKLNTPDEFIREEIHKVLNDTTIRPFSELEKIDKNQIATLNIEGKDDSETLITVVLKNGNIEKFRASKEELKKMLDNDAKMRTERTTIIEEERTIKQNTPQGSAKQDPKGVIILETKKMEAQTIDNNIYSMVEDVPQFVGGQDSMFRWLMHNIRYPKEAREKRVEGTVYIGFVVEKDGSITGVELKREPSYPKDTLKVTEINGMQGYKLVNGKVEGSLGREASRVISAMPKWKPGFKNGQAVRVAYTLPIKFKLE